MKRSIILLSVFVFFLSIMPMKANAAIVTQGTCGANLTWTLDNNGLLTISGTGKTDDYSEKWSFEYNYCISDAPWAPWRLDIKTVVIEDGVTYLGTSAFCACTNLEKIVMPDSSLEIKSHAFRDCWSLDNVKLPNGQRYFEGIFLNCYGLTHVEIPESAKSLLSTFNGCKSLTNITLPFGLTSISDSAFYKCENLTSIVIPDSVTYIGSYAFNGCQNLRKVVLSKRLNTINENAFNGCNNLSQITIPASVTMIKGGAFNSSSIKYCCCLQDKSTSVSLEVTSLPQYKGSTIYCYRDSDIDKWAADKACEVVYLDENDTDSIRTITMPADFQLDAGETRKIRPIVFPDDRSDIILTSSDDNIVTVSSDGNVTACALGKATITATVGSVSESVNITVVPHTIHRLTAHPKVDATCIEKGMEEFWSCSICGKMFSDKYGNTEIESPTEIPLIPHILVHHAKVESTCVEEGAEEYWTCDFCKKLFSDQNGEFEISAPVAIPLKEHTIVIDPLVDSTCTDTGLTEGQHCSFCGTIIVAQEIIPKKSHQTYKVETVPPTCTNSGTASHWKCSVCKKLFKDEKGTTEITAPEAQLTIPAAGHTLVCSFAEIKPGCTSPGYTEGSYCSVCGMTFPPEEIPATGHKVVTIAGVEATSSSSGLTAGSYCETCGLILQDRLVIPPKSPSNVVSFAGTWKAQYYRLGLDTLDVTQREGFKDWKIYLETDGTAISYTPNSTLGLDEWWVTSNKPVVGGVQFLVDSRGMIGMPLGDGAYMYYKKLNSSSTISTYAGTWKAYTAIKDSEGISVPVSQLNDSVYKKVFIHADDTIYIPSDGSVKHGNLTKQNNQLYVNGNASNFHINQIGQLIRKLNNGITLLYLRVGGEKVPDLERYARPWYGQVVVHKTQMAKMSKDISAFWDYVGIKLQINVDGTITEERAGRKTSGTWNIVNNQFVATGLQHEISWSVGDLPMIHLGNDTFMACLDLEPDYSQKKTYLPRSLQVVESEAFMATGIKNLVVPDTCQEIGKNAFNTCSELSIIYIPRSVVRIDDTAFRNSDNLLIICEANSEAAVFARRHGIQYVVR